MVPYKRHSSLLLSVARKPKRVIAVPLLLVVGELRMSNIKRAFCCFRCFTTKSYDRNSTNKTELNATCREYLIKYFFFHRIFGRFDKIAVCKRRWCIAFPYFNFHTLKWHSDSAPRKGTEFSSFLVQIPSVPPLDGIAGTQTQKITGQTSICYNASSPGNCACD